MGKNKIIIYTDGGARGNPGPAGIGIVVKDEEGSILEEYCEYIGETTNNQAEYKAVLKAFDFIDTHKPESVDFFLDSELVVNQLNGKYKIKNPDLAKLFVQIWNKKTGKKISFTHVPREQNKQADSLVNKAIDEHLNKGF